jgi:hypothetical protein
MIHLIIHLFACTDGTHRSIDRPNCRLQMMGYISTRSIGYMPTWKGEENDWLLLVLAAWLWK